MESLPPPQGTLGIHSPSNIMHASPEEINPGVCKADQYFIHRKEVENILTDEPQLAMLKEPWQTPMTDHI